MKILEISKTTRLFAKIHYLFLEDETPQREIDSQVDEYVFTNWNLIKEFSYNTRFIEDKEEKNRIISDKISNIDKEIMLLELEKKQFLNYLG